MSSEALAAPTSGGISLASLPVGTAPGDIFQFDGTRWNVVPNDNNNPLVLDGIEEPIEPIVDSGKLYKQTGLNGLWWVTNEAPAIDITLVSTTGVPQGLKVLMVNTTIPVASNNYHTIQAAINAATPGEYTVILITSGSYTENININKEVTLVSIAPQLGRGQSIVDTSSDYVPVTVVGETIINSACTCNGIYFRRNITAQAVVKIGNTWSVGGTKASAQFVSCGFLTESTSGITTEYAIQCIENNGSTRKLDFYNCSFKATSANVETMIVSNSNRILMNDTEVVGRTLLLGNTSYMVQHMGGSHNGFIDGTGAVAVNPGSKQLAYYAENVRFDNDGAVAATIRLATNLSAKIINCVFNQSAASPQNACIVFNTDGGLSDTEYINDGKNRFSAEARVRLNGATQVSYSADAIIPF